MSPLIAFLSWSTSSACSKSSSKLVLHSRPFNPLSSDIRLSSMVTYTSDSSSMKWSWSTCPQKQTPQRFFSLPPRTASDFFCMNPQDTMLNPPGRFS
eukprot:8113194-Prorocentrum_lima.AAC.1